MKNIFFIFAACILVGAGCATSQNTEPVHDVLGESDSEQVENMLPDLVLEDYDGNEVVLHDYIGTPLVVNSWAAWCPFCKKELPDFAAVQKEFEGEVVFIAINRKESLKKAKSYTDNAGVTDDMVFLLDSSDSFYKAIGGFSMPETIFVDTEGSISEVKRGVLTLEETREKVEKLLSEH